MPDKELRISSRKVKNSNKLCPTSIDERVFSYLSLLDFALRCPFFLCAILYFLFSFSGKYYNQRHTIDSVRITFVCSWYIYLGNAPPLMVSYSLQTFILKAPKKKSDNFLFAFLISSHSVLYSRFFFVCVVRFWLFDFLGRHDDVKSNDTHKSGSNDEGHQEPQEI